MNTTNSKPETVNEDANPVNDNDESNLFVMLDQHIARANRLFKLHGRGNASTKQAEIDSLDDDDLAEWEADGLIVPRPTTDTVERYDQAICPTENSKVKLLIRSLYPVGAQEESLLLVLLSLAARHKDEPDRESALINPESDYRAVAVKEIDAKGRGVLNEAILELSVTGRRLIEDLGMSKTSMAWAKVKARLRRLRWIGYTAMIVDGNHKSEWGGTQLLSYQMDHADDPDERITIWLCERFSRVLIGDTGLRPRALYDRIDLRERFALTSDAARLLHKRVSVDVPDPTGRGKDFGPVKKDYGLDALAREIYPAPGRPLSARAERKRVKTLRDAFIEIGTLSGWVVEAGTVIVTVRRRTAAENAKKGKRK